MGIADRDDPQPGMLRLQRAEAGRPCQQADQDEADDRIDAEASLPN